MSAGESILGRLLDRISIEAEEVKRRVEDLLDGGEADDR
jgi:hypothetical protein